MGWGGACPVVGSVDVSATGPGTSCPATAPVPLAARTPANRPLRRPCRRLSRCRRLCCVRRTPRAAGEPVPRVVTTRRRGCKRCDPRRSCAERAVPRPAIRLQQASLPAPPGCASGAPSALAMRASGVCASAGTGAPVYEFPPHPRGRLRAVGGGGGGGGAPSEHHFGRHLDGVMDRCRTDMAIAMPLCPCFGLGAATLRPCGF